MMRQPTDLETFLPTGLSTRYRQTSRSLEGKQICFLCAGVLLLAVASSIISSFLVSTYLGSYFHFIIPADTVLVTFSTDPAVQLYTSVETVNVHDCEVRRRVPELPVPFTTLQAEYRDNKLGVCGVLTSDDNDDNAHEHDYDNADDDYDEEPEFGCYKLKSGSNTWVRVENIEGMRFHSREETERPKTVSLLVPCQFFTSRSLVFKGLIVKET